MSLKLVDEFIDVAAYVVKPESMMERESFLKTIRFENDRAIPLFTRIVDFNGRFDLARTIGDVPDSCARKVYLRSIPRFMEDEIVRRAPERASE